MERSNAPLLPDGPKPVLLPQFAGPVPPAPRHHAAVLALAVIGGVLGIVGAVINEIQAGGWLLLVIVGAPIIEEVLKPTGVYLFLMRWRSVELGRPYTACLAALGGLTFGVIESVIYTTVYVSDPSSGFIIYRFSVTLALHAAASFIAGLGIDRGIIDWAAGRVPFPRRTLRFFAAAMIIHGVYNAVALGLEFSSLLDFE